MQQSCIDCAVKCIASLVFNRYETININHYKLSIKAWLEKAFNLFVVLHQEAHLIGRDQHLQIETEHATWITSENSSYLWPLVCHHLQIMV